MSDSGEETPVLLVFSDDWGRHPSSCQHLTRRLLGRHKIIWVNTIGMRTPSFSLATIKRGFEKIFQWVRRSKQTCELPDNLQVVNPRMWPWFSSARDRHINRRLLLRSLTPLVESQNGPVTAVTTIPIVADLIGELPVREWIYYCVDDFSVWPGLDQQAMLAMESDLIQKVDRIAAVSETLQERIQRAGRQSDLLTHGVDLDFWRLPGSAALPAKIDSYERPLLVFWGVVDRRLDSEFVRRLSVDLDQHGTILLVGPAQAPDPKLLALPGVRLLPPLPLESLPTLATQADVLIMPYQDAEVTRAMQPLKLKEYLATGKAVVVRDLPSTRPWSDCLDLGDSPEEFSRLVRLRLRSGIPREQQIARERLVEESWESKTLQFERHTLQSPLLKEAAL